MMRVLVDAVPARKNGVEAFLLGMLPPLARADQRIAWDVLAIEGRASLYRTIADNVSVRSVPDSSVGSVPRRLIHEYLSTPFRYLRDREYDLYFRTDGLIPPWVHALSVPTLATFHRTVHLLGPELLTDGRASRVHGRLLERLAMRAATALTTVSFHAKAEFSSYYPRAVRRMRVVYHGVDAKLFCPSNERPSAVRRVIGDEPYILSISNRHRHKNYVRLLEAYGALCKRRQTPEHLVLVGEAIDPDEETRLRGVILRFGLHSRIHLLGYMEQPEMAGLYGAARAYLLPSMVETFGMTILEAMACGAPVACSEFSALPEVGGDAALYFDPTSIEEIADAMERILDDRALRESLVAAGSRRAARLTWERAADRYRSLIHQTVAGQS